MFSEVKHTSLKPQYISNDLKSFIGHVPDDHEQNQPDPDDLGSML
jgi:hypothetical protein